MKANRFVKFMGLFIVVALLATCAPAAPPAEVKEVTRIVEKPGPEVDRAFCPRAYPQRGGSQSLVGISGLGSGKCHQRR